MVSRGRQTWRWRSASSARMRVRMRGRATTRALRFGWLAQSTPEVRQSRRGISRPVPRHGRAPPPQLRELLRGAGGVMRVGHRGAAALAPESSLEAIEAAAECGADAVELDVLPGLVVAHGPEVPPDAPRLDDALALAARLGLVVQLDVKHRGLAADVAGALRRRDLLDR